MAVMNDEEKAEYIAAKVRYIFVDDAPNPLESRKIHIVNSLSTLSIIAGKSEEARITKTEDVRFLAERIWVIPASQFCRR